MENHSVKVLEKEGNMKDSRPKRTPKPNSRLLKMQKGDSVNPKPPKQRKKDSVTASKTTASNDAATTLPSTSVAAIETKGSRCTKQELGSQKLVEVITPMSTSAPNIEAKGSRCTKQELRAHNFLKAKREIRLVIDCSKIDLDDINIDEMCSYIRTTSKVVNVVENEDRSIYFTSRQLMKKSYLKFIVKKFLRKKNLGAQIHVIGDGDTKYELRYFTLNRK